MPKPGPRPQPTVAKKLKGGRKTYHRPMPKNEPQPNRGDSLPRAPSHLNDVAKKEWKRTGGILWEAGALTDADLRGLEIYCSRYAEWYDAQEKLREHGVLIKAQSGFPMQSPYLTISNRAQDDCRRWLTEFGGTPSSRSRVTTVDKPKDVDPMEEYLKTGGKPRRVK